MIILNNKTSDRHYRTFEIHNISQSDLKNLEEKCLTENEWQNIFSVYISPKNSKISANQLSILGTYCVDHQIIRFLPRYPLLEGEHYLGAYDPEQISHILNRSTAQDNIHTALFYLTKPKSPPTTVIKIYPSTTNIPENLLRFYIYFSAPMREDQALQNIFLIDNNNQQISDVFLDPPQELWNTTRTRLTLLLNPGRVKSGLTAYNALGRALKSGKNYRLIINNFWQDAHGNPLENSFEKQFTVTYADVVAPHVDDWKITYPVTHTSNPITLLFNKPFDQVLLDICIQIKHSNGELVSGKTSQHSEEKAWQFTPEKPWKNQNYRLEIDGRLEDIAGNNLYGLFDRPGDQPLLTIKDNIISIPFSIP